MKNLLIFLFLFISIYVNGQVVLTVTGTTTTNSDDTWDGYNVSRAVPTTFTFNNNLITSLNTTGYQLQAGDEHPSWGYNNNLDGEVITGNKFVWNGSNMTSLTHSIFTGCNINAVIKYNYVYQTPMGAIRKSETNMVNTSGGVAYNIFNKGLDEVVVKGMSGVLIYNNTFYSNRTFANTNYGRGVVDVYTNTDVSPNSVSHNTKIKNNIFYTVNSIVNIRVLDSDALTGFESDYNIFYCENGDPLFNAGGDNLTLTQWQALGYDTHSVVVNPNFTNFTDFIPSARLNYGTNLGSTWQTGLSTSATWVVNYTPATTDQNGTWQVGARIFTATGTAPTVTTTAITSITTSSAASGGNVTSEGSASVTARGVCWSTSSNPTTSDSHTTNGSGAGSFTSSITSLSANTTYYVRAYAINSVNTSYGSNLSFTTSGSGGNTYYLSPSGNDSNTGTINSPWFTLNKAWSHGLSPSDIVYMRGGTYNYDSQQYLTGISGTNGNMITIQNYTGEVPIIKRHNTSCTYTTSPCGIYLEGNYIHFKGITISGWQQLNSTDYGINNMILQNANHNIIEQCVFSYGMIGLDINTNSTDNLILNCDSHHMYDPYSSDTYGNGDGINAHTDFGTTNTFRGCRVWYTSDDGFDFYNGNGLIIVDGCWSWMNGYRENKSTDGGDGYGFKLGTSANHSSSHLRTIQNCLAFWNGYGGFTQQGLYGISWVYNNTTYHNNNKAGEYRLGYEFNDNSIANILKNNVAYANQQTGGLEYSINAQSTENHNTWDGAVTLTSSDFQNIDSTGVSGIRQLDGSMPLLSFLHLASGSDLIGAGVNVGLSTDGQGVIYSNPPSMGAYEYSSGLTYGSVTTTTVSNVSYDGATFGGTVVSNGGDNNASAGVVYATWSNPTISSNQGYTYAYYINQQTNPFSTNLSGLLNSNTLYYYRAYITNSVGTTYGTQYSFTSIAYPTTTYLKNSKTFIKYNGTFINTKF